MNKLDNVQSKFNPNFDFEDQEVNSLSSTDKNIKNLGEKLVPKNDPKSFKVFEDKEIIKVHPLRNANHDFGSDVVRCGQLFKTVILQQGTTSCTQAVAAMLLLDNNKNIEEDYLSGSHGSNKDIIQDLKDKGLQPLEYSPKNIQEIKTPSIVTLNIDGNGHVVIVDDIKKDAVTIRDPYHGWMVDVEKESFTKAVVLKEKAIFVKCPIRAKDFKSHELLTEINKENRHYPKANLDENVFEDKSSSSFEENKPFSLADFDLK